jgi:hypothetical protein
MNHSPASAPQALRVEPRSETDTRFSGSWLVLVRLVCLTLCGLSVGLFVASILSYIVNHYLFCTGTAAACYAHGQLTPGDVRWLQELGLSRDFIALYPIVLDSLLSLGNWLVAASSSGASRMTVWRSWPPSPWLSFRWCSIMA